MTKIIHEAFASIDEYFISLSVDTVTGFYVLEVGVPDKWAFSSSRGIECNIVAESEEGKILKISTSNDDTGIDDLIDYVKVIVDTNMKIVKKEEEFKEKMNEMKKQLEEEARKFYAELDTLKDNSFKKLAQELNPNPNDGQKKRTKKVTYKTVALTGATS